MKRLLRKGFKGEKTAFTVETKELEEDSDDVFGDGGASDDDDNAGDDDDAPLEIAGSESDKIHKAESTTSSTAAAASVALVASKKKAKKSKKKTQVVRKVSAGTRKTWCCVSCTDSTIHEASQSAASFGAVWKSNKSPLRGRRSFSSKKKKKSRWKQ